MYWIWLLKVSKQSKLVTVLGHQRITTYQDDFLYILVRNGLCLVYRFDNSVDGYIIDVFR